MTPNEQHGTQNQAHAYSTSYSSTATQSSVRHPTAPVFARPPTTSDTRPLQAVELSESALSRGQSSWRQRWETRNTADFGPRLGGDAVAAGCSALFVAPVITVIDRYVRICLCKIQALCIFVIEKRRLLNLMSTVKAWRTDATLDLHNG